MKFDSRGQIGTIWVMILLIGVIVFALVGVFTHMAMKEVQNSTSELMGTSIEANDSMTQSVSQYPLIIDYATPFFIVIIAAVGLLTSYYLAQHPIIRVFLIVFDIVAIIILMVLSNMWSELISDADLVAYTDSFPISIFIIDKLPIIGIIIFALCGGVALFRASA